MNIHILKGLKVVLNTVKERIRNHKGPLFSFTGTMYKGFPSISQAILETWTS